MVTWNDSLYDPGHATHFGLRTPLTVALSGDAGATWSHRRTIEDDPAFAYSNPACTVTGDGRAFLTYWLCPYAPDGRMDARRIDLKLAVFDLDWLYS